MRRTLLVSLALGLSFLQAGDARAEEGHHRHHLALFGGAAFGEEAAAALGGDYDLRLGHRFGIGTGAEVAFHEHKEYSFRLGVLVFPVPHMKLVAQALYAIEEEYESAIGEKMQHDGMGARFGSAFPFDVGRFSVAPAVYGDLIFGHVSVVLGLEVGAGF